MKPARIAGVLALFGATAACTIFDSNEGGNGSGASGGASAGKAGEASGGLSGGGSSGGAGRGMGGADARGGTGGGAAGGGAGGAGGGAGMNCPGDASCLRGDTDCDGVNDCLDECYMDPNKQARGLCGCGVPDVDSDGDGTLDCMDECLLDPKHARIGHCGCEGRALPPAPVGTPCTDGPCRTNGIPVECDAEHTCGDPNACQPEPGGGCTLIELGSTEQQYYWFCPTPATWDQARTRCLALSGRALVDISDSTDERFISSFVSGTVWIGASDLATEGEWYWYGTNGEPRRLFWTGGPDGDGEPAVHSVWAEGEPKTDPGANCAAKTGNRWSAEDCTRLLPYVCEQRATGL